ncbi:MAG: aminoglycoside phosphotransferase family protein [Muribaculaceae bacterium]|nr:aminoglycoside phosphotransferase family protein [Muribaculaceae bacterium]
MKDFSNIVNNFAIKGRVESVKPLGNGLINDTYIVKTSDESTSDYVLQRINHHIFTDVDTLQDNIAAVTSHIRRKLTNAGEKDIDRKVLNFLPVKDNPSKTYFYDGESYWRMMVFIPHAHTLEAVTPESSRFAGKAFGNFQAMLVDIDKNLKESIPDFHNMEFRLKQLHDAVAADPAGRVKEVKPLLDELESRADEMCKAERLYREGKLPKRICHCDTKVNNMMFDEDGSVLCVIDLDTVMPSFIFSDYGDFLRTGANSLAEDDPNIDGVEFNMAIFRAFTEGYLSSAKAFLTPIEIENLPYAVALFPYMQAVRFLTDYINGDTYYKIKYPEHNLVRTRNQFKLLQSIEAHTDEMKEFIKEKLK